MRISGIGYWISFSIEAPWLKRRISRGPSQTVTCWVVVGAVVQAWLGVKLSLAAQGFESVHLKEASLAVSPFRQLVQHPQTYPQRGGM